MGVVWFELSTRLHRLPAIGLSCLLACLLARFLEKLLGDAWKTRGKRLENSWEPLGERLVESKSIPTGRHSMLSPSLRIDLFLDFFGIFWVFWDSP